MPNKNNFDKPRQIKLTTEEAASLQERVLNLKELSKSEKELVAGLISFNLWLQQQLGKANFRIRQLKKLFGFSTEKKSPPPMM